MDPRRSTPFLAEEKTSTLRRPTGADGFPAPDAALVRACGHGPSGAVDLAKSQKVRNLER
jgi:hypothetical protein